MKATSKSTRVINLELSEYEARVLRAILHHVGGDPKGARGVTNELVVALDKLGVENQVDLVSRKPEPVIYLK